MGAYNISGEALRAAYSVSGSKLSVVYKTDGTPIYFDSFRQTAIISEMPTASVSGTKQGACTDGEYFYGISFNSGYTSGNFIKYKISDGTYSKVSFDSTIPYNHGNDMAYNPNNKHVYVASMSSDGSVMELDNEFNYVTTHYLETPTGTHYAVWGLCFDQNTNYFLSLHGNTTILVYDQNFNLVSSILMPNYPSATGQGCETDGSYIYRITYNPNLIDVATIEGEYVTTIDNPMPGEPETMMYDWINDRYYMYRNHNSQLFYEVEIKQ